jgi:hypothetical protein
MDMQALFASGHAVDIVLAVLLAEFVWLRIRGDNTLDIALMLAPAALILLGLRAALTGSDWVWVALPLAASFPVHLADLSRRTRRRD